MHVVVIHGWKEECAELVQAIAVASGMTAYEARQRMIGGGPSLLASFAEPELARSLSIKLTGAGVGSFVVDTTLFRSDHAQFAVRRFELGERALHLEAVDGLTAEIPYGEVELLLPGTRISGQTESKTITERKFSLGRTVLSGGIPLTKKVSRQEEVTTEDRTKCLYLYARRQPQVIFRQSGMSYDGFGAAMKLSQELNFAYLINELRRLCGAAAFDERLVNRLGQVRLLGPAQSFEAALDLAAEVQYRSLRR
jgi:hypothetical protein